MDSMIRKTPVAIALSAAIALGSFGTSGVATAAPLATNAQALKEAAPSDVVDVRRWRRHRGAAVAGLALGIIGAAIVAREYDRRHREYYGYYDHPQYYYGGRSRRSSYYYRDPSSEAPTQFCHICGVN
jgi:hypothetical protein